MALTRVDSASTLNSTVASTIDLSAAVTAGSTNADIVLVNVSDFPVTVSRRDTGDSVWVSETIHPEQSMSFTATLTAAVTLDYKVNEGEIWAYVGYFWGTGLSTTLSVSDVIDWLEMLEYTISDAGALKIAEVQLCLNNVTVESNRMAGVFELKRGVAPDSSYKDEMIKIGAVAKALYVIRNVGATRGLTSDMIITSAETADRLYGEYVDKLERMRIGSD